MQRLMERQYITETRAKKRIKAQMPLNKKCELAHFVIENSGSLEDTREQVLKIVSNLKSSRYQWRFRIIAGLFCTGIISLLLWFGTHSYNENKIILDSMI